MIAIDREIMTCPHPDPLILAVVGTHTPRQCGIATFTADLCHSMKSELSEAGDVFAVAMNERPNEYEYPPMVKFEIQRDVAADYRMAADYLNLSHADVVIIEHEFGIFGGDAGNYLNGLLGALRKPVIVTLHTMLSNPDSSYRIAMDRIIHASERLVVMSRRGGHMLKMIYQVPESKIAFIPHGIPDVPFMDPNFHKDDLRIAGRRAILTFGLLSPNKGIDMMIRALPEIVKNYPDTVYIVLGATHPKIVQRSGEAYREGLMTLARDLGVAENIMFVNQFVNLEELCRYIGAADIYVTPYRNREQITSGTLAYALGAGKAVVSTPYWYAEELLAEGRGRLVDFGNSELLSQAIINLFDDEVERHAIRKRAYMHARNMLWSEVAKDYITLAHDVIRHRNEKPRHLVRSQNLRTPYLPEIRLEHLRVLTDRIGLYRHAKYAIPYRRFGYCTEDNALGLVFLGKHWALYEDRSILPFLNTYLAFLTEAFDEKSRRFRNALSFDLKWPEETGSETCHGRALWGLGSLVPESPNQAALTLAARLFLEALPSAMEFESPQAIAATLAGVNHYLLRFKGDTEVRRIRRQLADRLLGKFEARRADWLWCEERIGAVHARMPAVLIQSGENLGDNRMVELGLECLRWLLANQTGEENHLSLIGDAGWLEGQDKPHFDQKPIDAMTLVEACATAYTCTKDLFWAGEARRCFEWFLGRNDLNVPLYDLVTGGCRDGLQCTGVNENEGAEATLSWLITLAAMHRMKRQFEVPNETQTMVEPTRPRWFKPEIAAQHAVVQNESI
jgi:glycosyltransferase involved in cell wall biosynthesis